MSVSLSVPAAASSPDEAGEVHPPVSGTRTSASAIGNVEVRIEEGCTDDTRIDHLDQLLPGPNFAYIACICAERYTDRVDALDDFERSVLARSRRVGIIWCALGVVGLIGGLSVAIVLLLGGYGTHPMVLLVLVGWAGVSGAAAKNGWASVGRASRALRDPSSLPATAHDLDEPLDP